MIGCLFRSRVTRKLEWGGLVEGLRAPLFLVGGLRRVLEVVPLPLLSLNDSLITCPDGLVKLLA